MYRASPTSSNACWVGASPSTQCLLIQAVSAIPSCQHCKCSVNCSTSCPSLVPRRFAYASVTHPVEAEDTFLMYLYRVPEVACRQRWRGRGCRDCNGAAQGRAAQEDNVRGGSGCLDPQPWIGQGPRKQQPQALVVRCRKGNGTKVEHLDCGKPNHGMTGPATPPRTDTRAP